MATIGTLVMYLLATIAAMWVSSGAVARTTIVLGAIFALFALYGSGLEANAWGLLLLVVGMLVRSGTRAANAQRAATA